jgi:hypothetical protein
LPRIVIAYHAQKTVAESRGEMALLQTRLQQEHERRSPFLDAQLNHQ